MVELYVRARTAMWALADGVRDRARDERGALSVEYVGIVMFVVALVAALIATGIAGKITTRVRELTEKILGTE